MQWQFCGAAGMVATFGALIIEHAGVKANTLWSMSARVQTSTVSDR